MSFDPFDLRKFLTENKLTKVSKLVSENLEIAGQESANISEEEYDTQRDYELEKQYGNDPYSRDKDQDWRNKFNRSSDRTYKADSTLNTPEEEIEEENDLVLQPDVDDKGPDVSRYLSFGTADDVIREIESEVAKTTMEAKMAKIKEVIEALDNKANSLEEDANLKGFVNTGKLKEMRRMSKKLRVMEEKYQREFESKFSDKKKKAGKKA